MVRAAAGTGKTRLVGTFAKAWTEATGGDVHVVTVSENAARVAATEMDAAGAEVRAANLARFLGKRPDGTLGRPADVGARDVIVLDEASQVSTADWLHLADARRPHAAPASSRWVMSTSSARSAPAACSPCSPTGTARSSCTRCTGSPAEWEKHASLALRDGDVGVIADYQVQGRVFPAPEDQAMRNVVLDWAADIQRRPGRADDRRRPRPRSPN